MKTFILFLALLGLVACGGGDGGGAQSIPGSGLPALTQSEKDRVAAISVQTAMMSDVSDAYGPEQRQMPAEGNWNPFSPAAKPIVNKEWQEKKAADIKDELDQAINSGDCVVEFFPSQMQAGSTNPPENVEVGFAIQGAKSGLNRCPISYKNINRVQTSGSETQATVKTKSTVDFKVNQVTGSFETIDVTSFNLDMDSTVNTTFSNNTARLVMTMAGRGQVSSKVDGAVTMAISLGADGQFSASESGQGATGTTRFRTTFTVEFKEKNAFKVVGYADVTLKMKDQSMETVGQFYINGKPVSQEEFNSLFMTDLSMENTYL